MSKKKHIYILILVTLAWLAFYLIGLPSEYFKEWSLSEKILLSWIGFFAIIPFIGFLVIILLEEDYIKSSLWAAFYASIVPLILDFIVVGLFKGEGINFIFSHWYLSIAYLYVWFELPLIGLALKKLKTKII